MIPLRCAKVAANLNADDTAAVNEAIDTYTESGVSEEQSAAMAVSDILAQAESEKAEYLELINTQYPDILVKKEPVKPVKSKPDQEVKPVAKSSYGAKNKLVTKDDYADIQRKLKEKLGKLNSGIDPELITLGTQAAVYHIEAGARTFAEFSKTMVGDFGDTIKPYLRSWYEAARYYPGSDDAGMSSAAEIELFLDVGEKDATSKPVDMEQDSGITTATVTMGGKNVQVEPGASDPYLGGPGGKDEQVRVRQQTDTSVPDSAAPLPGTDGNLELFDTDGTVRTDPGFAGGTERAGGSTTDAAGIPSGRKTNKQVNGDVRSTESKHAALKRKQREAGNLPVKLNDSDNVNDTLPALYPEQRDDVLFAEARFFIDNKKGALFTNGTGTGKTYTGLGIAKRFFQRGKKRILIVVPTDAKAKDWIEDGRNVNLSINQLSGITDSGSGAVTTTYANFRDNKAVAGDDWDLVIYDESHYLNSNKAAENTASHTRHHEVTNHEKGYYGKAQVLTPEYQDAMERSENLSARMKKEADKLIKETGVSKWKAKNKVKVLNQVEENEIAAALKRGRELVREKEAELRAKPDNVKTVFLSASPFAYDKNIDYAEGYLFDYDKMDPSDSLGYNVPNGREKFFVEHFGYRMRYNKLTEPEAEVNRDLMERQFHQWMRDQGSLSGRVLSVESDYSRQFIDVKSGIGHEIDRGYGILTEYDPDLVYMDKNGNEQTGRNVYPILGKMVRKKFDYHYTMRLLETVKTQGAIERAKQHIALGRKVVVFHSYNEGQPAHPFLFSAMTDKNIAEIERKFGKDAAENARDYNKEVNKFNSENKDIMALDLNGLVNPIVAFGREFGDKLALFNGRIPKKTRRAKLKEFNRDGSGTDVILLQMEAGKEGLSAHDISGKHQRVMIQLGLPLKPVDAIQTEGRIFRLGVKSNGIFEYMKVGTSMESYKFGTTISQRSRTAENLALGDQARDLERSFIEAYLDSSAADPSDKQGLGGKEGDARVITESEFDAAISFYYGNQKRTSKNKAREGRDYFATPEPLGQKMVEWLDLKPGEKAGEPSAGHGAISRWFPEENRVVAIEPSGELFGRLSMHTRGNLINGRFEDLDLHNKFDAIAMNPPFGVGGKMAMEHLAKAFKHLRNGGRVIAIVPAGPSMDKRFDKWYQGKEAKNAYKMREVKLPAVSFKRAGTQVNARILIIDKYTDEKEVPQQYGEIDLSRHTDINEFFESIRDLDMGDRGEVKEVETEEVEGEGEATGAAALFAGGRGAKLPDRPKVDAGQVSGAAEAKAEIVAGEHTKFNYPIWTVVMKDRVERDVYLSLKAEAKKLGGRYSAYKGNNAIPGFIFKDAESANKFMAAFESGVGELGSPYGRRRDYNASDIRFAAQLEDLEKRVDAAYESGNYILAERLDARLADFSEREVDPDYEPDYESETNYELVIAKEYYDNFVTGELGISQGRFANEEEFANNIRANLEESNLYATAKDRKRIAALSDAETIDIAKDAYDSRVAMIDRQRSRKETFVAEGDETAEYTEVKKPDPEKKQLDMFTDAPMFPGKKAEFIHATEKIQTGTFDITVEKVTTPEHAASIMYPLAEEAAENFATLVLDNNKKPIAVMRQFFGTVDGASVYPREVATLLMMIPDAKYIWFSHNHPSGVTDPSHADRNITSRLVQSLEGTGIEHEGHVIMGKGTPTEPVMASGFKKDESDYSFAVGEKKPIFTVPEYRGRKLVKFGEPGEVLDAPNKSRIFIADKPEGLHLMDNRNRIIGYSPLSMADVVRNKKDKSGWRAELIRVIGQSNASAIIIKVDKLHSANEMAMKQFKEAAALIDVRVLDGIDNDGVSAAEKGILEEPVTYYQRGTKGIGMRVSQVQRVVDRVQKKYKGMLAARIIVRKDDMHAFGKKIPGKAVKGGFDPDTNTITILAHNMDNDADVLKTIRHEVFTHFGMRQLMNDTEMTEFLDLVREARSTDDAIGEIYESVAKAYPNLIPEPYKLAEEVVARAGERNTSSAFMNKIRALIIKIMRRLGLIDAPITVVELNAMIDKSAANLRAELYNPRVSTGDLMYAADNPVFYSQMLTTLDKKLPGKGQVGQFKMMINNMASKGDFKAEELQWSGVNEWLDDQEGKITKDEVLAFVNSHQVEIKEVSMGGSAGRSAMADIERIKTSLRNYGVDTIVDAEGYISGVKAVGDDFESVVLFESDDTDNGLFPDYDKFDGFMDTKDLDTDLLKEMLAKGGVTSREQIERDIYDLFENVLEVRSNEDMGYNDPELTQYQDYQLPGGENYTELLLTLPTKRQQAKVVEKDGKWFTQHIDGSLSPYGTETKEQADRALNEYVLREQDGIRSDLGTYKSAHWHEPNILAHVRFNERTDAGGKRVLFIEETQSDWHQAGRKGGYKVPAPKIPEFTVKKIKQGWSAITSDNKEIGFVGPAFPEINTEELAREYFSSRLKDRAETRSRIENSSLVPNAPFKTTWPMLVMKRMIRHAAENGFDRIAWTTGEQQAERYNLSKKISYISYSGNTETDGHLWGSDINGREILSEHLPHGDKKLSDYVGAELAKKLLAEKMVDRSGVKVHTLSGLDLDVGGEGMKGFYDSMLPKMVNKYVKKFGAKVSETSIDVDTDYDKTTRLVTGKEVKPETTTVHSLNITPKMHAAAMSGQVMFQRSDPDYETARGKVGKKGRRATLSERYNEIKGTLGLRFRQGVVDRYGSLRKLDDTVWKLARGTHHVSGAVEAAFKYGKIFLDADGALDIDTAGKGLAEMLSPLGHEIDDFMFWMIGNRAYQLKQEDREHLFSDAEIKSFMSRNQGEMSRGRDRGKVYEQARKDLMAFQESILEIGIKTDTISREEADTWNKEFYIPFYRILEDQDGNEKVRGAQTLDGLTGQTAIKRLKGGTKNLNDPLANILMNWHHVLSASMKNQAASATVLEATEAGIMQPVTKADKSDKAFFVRVAGKKHWFDIIRDAENPIVPPDLVLESLTMLNQPTWNNAGMKSLRMFKRIFTIGVTAAPEFRIANLLRDTMHSVAVGKMNYNMLDNVYEGWKGTEVGSDVEKRMMAGGGTVHFGLQYGDDPEAARMLIEEHIEAETLLTDERGAKKYKHALKGLWTIWRDFGNRIENVNRAALYKKRIGENVSHFQAAHESRDLLDFFQGGSWPAVRFLTQVVPFLNARLQGLDKMYRAGITPEQKKQLYIVLGTYITATLALYLLYRDDEDFKAREEWDRDSYHWFKAPGSDLAFRIPKPFEVGAIGTMAERALEFAIDDDAHIDLFAERLGHVFWQTFEFDPIPQAARPILNIYANKDPFTKRPIESAGMSKLSPAERKYSYTSETAIGMSNAFDAIGWDKVNLSPIQIEYLIRGYLGWAGSFSLGAIDNLITRPVTEREMPFMGDSRPERAIDEWPITRRFVQSLPIKRTKYTTMFYENMKEINTAYADMANYRKLGEMEKARDIMIENRDKIGLRKIYASASKKLTQINNQMRRVRGNKKMTAKQKKNEINRLRLLKNAITERVVKKTQERLR